MHTVVIHLQDPPQDWHLIDPFFYKVQASGHMSIFHVTRDENKVDFYRLFTEVMHHLSRMRISSWQAIFLSSVSSSPSNKKRVTRQLLQLKEELFSLFEEQELPPESVSLLLLDPLKRNSTFAPEEIDSQIFWQLDNKGYLFLDNDSEDSKAYSNMFTKSNLEELDASWGNRVSLKDAGLHEKPDATFLQLLEEKKERTFKKWKELVQNKKECLAKEKDYIEEHLSLKQLNEIDKAFRLQLKEITTPPFKNNSELHDYLPSNTIKALLKEVVSLSSTIHGFRVFRQTSAIYSVEKRTSALLSVAYFLNAVSIHHDIISHIPEGTIHELEVELNNEELAKLFTHYDSTLHAAKVKLENKLLERQTLTHKKYEEVKATPHTTSPLKETNIKPEPFSIARQKTFMNDWDIYIKLVEEDLAKREELMLTEAKSGAKKIQLIKRRKPVQEGEEVEIRNYIE